MKKTVTIVLVFLSIVMMLCACKPVEEMGDMVETVISTILPTEIQDNTNNSGTNGENGTINDHDGYIGNENSETHNTTTTTADTGSVADDNVM